MKAEGQKAHFELFYTRWKKELSSLWSRCFKKLKKVLLGKVPKKLIYVNFTKVKNRKFELLVFKVKIDLLRTHFEPFFFKVKKDLFRAHFELIFFKVKKYLFRAHFELFFFKVKKDQIRAHFELFFTKVKKEKGSFWVIFPQRGGNSKSLAKVPKKADFQRREKSLFQDIFK